jgi:hypothetical protein
VDRAVYPGGSRDSTDFPRTPRLARLQGEFTAPSATVDRLLFCCCLLLFCCCSAAVLLLFCCCSAAVCCSLSDTFCTMAP